jgi:alkyl hydroperoxide reductase subunit AhpF
VNKERHHTISQILSKIRGLLSTIRRTISLSHELDVKALNDDIDALTDDVHDLTNKVTTDLILEERRKDADKRKRRTSKS